MTTLSADGFRWQAFFARSADPVFVLDRRRRPLYVNAAWESLTGIPAAEARRLVCRRPRPANPGDSVQAVVEHALTPPPEVRQGTATRVRRLLPGREPARRWWDVDFLPLRQPGDAAAVLILGRITPVAAADPVPAAPLPERLTALRDRMTRRYGPDLLACETPALRLLADQARLAARTAVPVLLVGEPGTGKQTLARFIHYQGPNRDRPFAALNCARLPADALADVLFGGAGAALGAVYLMGPSHLPRDLQARLCGRLHAAAEDDGAPAPRVLAGCSADPAEEVRAGRLLDELHAALAVLTLRLPPLRERLADLPALVDRLLERCDAEGEVRVRGLAPDAWEVVREHRWPGNLRELYAVLSAARRQARTEFITAADLPAELRLLRRLEETPGRRPERPLPLDALLEQAERRLIELALRRARGKKVRAAEILAIWRTRLSRRMKALGIEDAEAPTPARSEDAMRLPQIVVYEKDGRLKVQLEALAERQRWALREARQAETCLRLLRAGGPAVLVVKAGRDLEREMGLLERAAWLYPDAPAVLVGDGDRPELAGLAWDLGAACVLLPPQPRERLPEIVAGLMRDKAEGTKS